MWWWWGPPTVALMMLFIGLFLISTALDEFANPRLRERAG
jgi:peptide/nickel transport system permease protein